jgi:hypothetical protein
MIPAAYIAKKVVEKKMSGNTSNPRPDKVSDLQRKATIIGLGALGVGITYFIGKRIIKNIRKTSAERRFTQEGQQALLLRSALNPTGVSWMMWMDGTKEKTILNVAAQITNFRKVQQEYQSLFNSSIVTDLQKELSPDEYTQFMNIINSGGIQNQTVDTGITNGNYTIPDSANNDLKGKVILIKNSTKLYEKFTWYPLGSIKKVEPNYFINYLTTGNIKKVPLAYGFTVEFVETRIKTVEGSVKTIYVNKADIMLVSKEDFQNNFQNSYTKLNFSDNEF